MITVTIMHEDLPDGEEQRTFADTTDLGAWIADEPHNPLLVRYDGARKIVQILRGSPTREYTTVVEHSDRTYRQEYSNPAEALRDFLNRI